MFGSAIHERTHDATPSPALVTLVESEACHFCADAHQALADFAVDYPLVVAWPSTAARTWCCTSTRARAASPASSRWVSWRRRPPSSKANVTVLPIVMNTRDQILRDMELNGVTTPFLLDDGTVADAYGTLGKGMHAGLPGHSFVLIDAQGQQRWYGEYPSMWLDPGDLLDEIRNRLDA